MKKFKVLSVGFALLIVSAVQVYAETTFDITGQIRFRPEMRENSDFNDAKDDEFAFIGSRMRLNVKATVQEGVIGYLSFQDVRRFGQESNVATSTEEQSVDVFEGYFLVKNIKDSPLSVKVGRQVLKYGDQRLLGELGWVDQARTHDAAKVMLNFSRVKIDIFASKENESGKPSASNYDDDLYGIYTVIKAMKGVTVDVYALDWKTANKKTVTNADGTTATTPISGKDFITFGSRVAVKFNGFDFTGEYAVQDGDWSDTLSQSASAYAVKAGYKFGFWNTRLGVEYDAGSGDSDPTDGTHETFVFPFHTNHAFYGHMDFFSWGNMSDLRFSVVTKPAGLFVTKIDYHIFSLDEANDAWLNVVGTKPFRPAVAGSTSTDAGEELDLTVVYKALPNLKIVTGYSFFEPGDAAKERSGGNDDTATWGYLMTVFNF